MEQVIGTMQGITDSSRKIVDIIGVIGEMSSATQEQTQGISQVGDAVTQLDQITQQNTSLVEEGAAAAESLNHQAANPEYSGGQPLPPHLLSADTCLLPTQGAKCR